MLCVTAHCCCHLPATTRSLPHPPRSPPKLRIVATRFLEKFEIVPARPTAAPHSLRPHHFHHQLSSAHRARESVISLCNFPASAVLCDLAIRPVLSLSCIAPRRKHIYAHHLSAPRHAPPPATLHSIAPLRPSDGRISGIGRLSTLGRTGSITRPLLSLPSVLLRRS